MKKLILTLLTMILMIALVLTGCTTPTLTTKAPTAVATTTAAAAATTSGAAVTTATGGTTAATYDSSPVDKSKIPTTGIGAQITTTVKAKEKFKIAIVVKNTTNPFMLKSITGAQKAATDMGFECISLSPARQDSLEDQVKIIEDAIQQGVKGIILHPIDSNGIMPAIRKAQAAKIPVACIGTPASEQTFLRTGVDYFETGSSITKLVAEKMGKQGKMIILEGPPGAQNAQERLAGIKKALESYPNITVVASQTTNFKRTEGLQVTENLLQKYKDVNAIVACNDESALGAVQALKAAGLEGKVIVAGFDANQDGSAAIKSGQMFATYNTDPFGSTYVAAAFVVKFLNDGTMPPKYFVPFPSLSDNPIVTSANIDAYMANVAWWK